MSKLIASLIMVSAIACSSAVIAGGKDDCGSSKPMVSVKPGDDCGSSKPIFDRKGDDCGSSKPMNRPGDDCGSKKPLI